MALVSDSSDGDVCCLMPGSHPTKKPRAVPARISTQTIPVTDIANDRHGNTRIITHSHAVVPDPPPREVPPYNPLEDNMQNGILDAGSTDNASYIFI